LGGYELGYRSHNPLKVASDSAHMTAQGQPTAILGACFATPSMVSLTVHGCQHSCEAVHLCRHDLKHRAVLPVSASAKNFQKGVTTGATLTGLEPHVSHVQSYP
jgi:hypothetical protein